MEINMKLTQEMITACLDEIDGKTSFYYKNLVTGEVMAVRPQEKLLAASVIKLFVLVYVFSRFEDGTLDPQETMTLREQDKVPPSGALYFLHEGLEVTLMDLCKLMIVFSDNVATNLLCDRVGISEIVQWMKEQGYTTSVLARKMYDVESAQKGLQNYICATEVADLLERLYKGSIVSEKACTQMLQILKEQQVNGKIPFFLERLEDAPEIAHKTGEDDGITNDVGIVFAKEPFMLLFLGNEVDTAEYERLMQDLSLELYYSE